MSNPTKKNLLSNCKRAKKAQQILDEEVGLAEWQREYEKAQPSFCSALLLRYAEKIPLICLIVLVFILLDSLDIISDKYFKSILIAIAIIMALIWDYVFTKKIKSYLIRRYQDKKE